MLISLGANRLTAWNPASFSHKAHFGVLLCERRKPDGLFTFNKIILEEIVISQRNFLASSAIFASTLIQEAGGLGGVCSQRGKRPGKRTGGQKILWYTAWAAVTPGQKLGDRTAWAHIRALPVTPHNLAELPGPSRISLLLGNVRTI